MSINRESDGRRFQPQGGGDVTGHELGKALEREWCRVRSRPPVLPCSVSVAEVRQRLLEGGGSVAELAEFIRFRHE